ncbi:MAG: PQQ-binding-like beta-propeller repeat protein [Candidatus Bathyarchaeia archaeon]
MGLSDREQSEGSVVCSGCGKTMPSSLEYCSNCGKKLPAVAQPEEAEIRQERPPSEEDWPMLRRDAAYTGSDGTPVQAPLEKVWEFRAGGNIESSPAVAYGMVFFGSKDKNVYAIDAATGRRRWVFKTRKSITTSPVVADGIVYVASNDKNLYAIDAQTGQKRWQFSTGNDISSTPAVGHGMVFFGCKDKHIYAIDTQTGQRRWVFESDYKDHSAPTIADGKVLISGRGFTSRKLYAIDAVSGALVWEQKGYLANPCPIVMGNMVLAYDSKGRLSKIDLASGAEQDWLFGSEASSATISGGVVFATFRRPAGLYAYNLSRTGLSFTGWDWVATVEEGSVSAPAVGGEFAFVAVLGGKKLYGINVSRFMKRWEFYLNEKIKCHPVIAGGMVFVASDKGKIHAFRGAKDPRAASILEYVAGEIAKVPKFRAMLYQQYVSWPSCCCLCCGPVEERMAISRTEGKMIFTLPNVPYCTPCHKRVKKLFRAEKSGVEILKANPTILAFRNERYWAMFLEANRLR